MDSKEEIFSVLKIALKELGLSGVEPQLEHPAEEGHGDYASNIAIVIFSKSKFKNQKSKWATPLDLAKEIVSELNTSSLIPNTCSRIEAAPPGFINFWLSKDYLITQLQQVLERGEEFGTTARLRRVADAPKLWRRSGFGGQRKKILVEFAHPNTHKLFHIGHLRNITLGESICRLLESQQAKVTRANYQGDIGLHIAKALWGTEEKIKIQNSKIKNLKTKALQERITLLASAYVEGNKAYEEDEGRKKEIEEINKKLYEDEPEVRELWEETRAWSLEYFDQIYKRVGTKFDRLYFESEAAEPGKKLVLKNINKVFKKDQGAVIFPGEKYGLHNRVFINSLGLPTYEAKDIGLAKLQLEEFLPDRIIHVVGPEQKSYFEVVFKAIELVFPELSGREEHLEYGWVRLKEGKMSSRAGEVVEGEWLLDETKKRLEEKYEMPKSVAEKVAVGAVKYSMLRLHPQSEIAFDIDESIRLDGDSGPYLQYTYARCRSVLREAVTRNLLARDSLKKERVTTRLPDGQVLRVNELQPEELVILRHFYKFSEVVQEAAEKFSPNLLCSFLFELAQGYNAFYNKHRILELSAKRLTLRATFRLVLTEVIGDILKTGLGLLGIGAPERM